MQSIKYCIAQGSSFHHGENNERRGNMWPKWVFIAHRQRYNAWRDAAAYCHRIRISLAKPLSPTTACFINRDPIYVCYNFSKYKSIFSARH